LIDISVVEPRLDALCDRYRGSMLNDLPEFAGKNPGIEQFASIIAERLAPELARTPVHALTVKIWESDTAYATCRRGVG
jgi:6-pyruvoyltetrahydropterin/6-carboxytetrahydropterin synthase